MLLLRGSEHMCWRCVRLGVHVSSVNFHSPFSQCLSACGSVRVCVCVGGGGGDVRIFVLEVMCKTFNEVL